LDHSLAHIHFIRRSIVHFRHFTDLVHHLDTILDHINSDIDFNENRKPVVGNNNDNWFSLVKLNKYQILVIK